LKTDGQNTTKKYTKKTPTEKGLKRDQKKIAEKLKADRGKVGRRLEKDGGMIHERPRKTVQIWGIDRGDILRKNIGDRPKKYLEKTQERLKNNRGIECANIAE
jgi:hypothetical protein